MMAALLVSFLCFLLHGTDSIAFPLGIRMCEQKCLSILGCNGFQLQKENLLCRVMTEKPGKDLPGYVVMSLPIRKKNTHVCSLPECQVGDRCITTRGNKLLCIGRAGDLGLSQRELQEAPRLICVSAAAEGKSHQMNLQTKHIQEYRYAIPKLIKSVCYMSEERRLLISTSQPKHLLFHYIDTNNNTVFRKGYSFKSMSIDEKSQQIFGCSGKRIFRLSLIGRADHHFGIQGRFSTIIQSIANINKKLLYIYVGTHVISSNYDGQNQRYIFAIYTDTSKLIFDQWVGVFYFNIVKSIWGRKLTSTRSYMIREISTTPVYMLYYDHILYVTTPGGGLFVVNVSGRISAYNINSSSFDKVCFIAGSS